MPGATHHALAEVVGVDARQRPHEEGQHVRGALGEPVAPGDQAARHADHAAQRGRQLVRLRQRLHGGVRPAGGVSAQRAGITQGHSTLKRHFTNDTTSWCTVRYSLCGSTYMLYTLSIDINTNCTHITQCTYKYALIFIKKM